MITQVNQLDELQLKDLKTLRAECKKNDGSIPNLYIHILKQHRSLPTNFLYYQNGVLIGFLSVYFFYDDAVEVAVLVSPQYRRQGIAKQLIKEALPLIKSQNYFNLIFSCPSRLNDNWLTQKGFTYLHSEYFMERDDLNPILDYIRPLSFRMATLEDIPILCGLDEVCFPDKNQDSVNRFQQILNEREYEIVIAMLNNHPIGKAHIRWQTKRATLSDIAILPKEQGKGFGSALIAHCINMILSEGKSRVDLDVETHNKKALNLYIQLGFHIQNACDYWSINVNQLAK
ncbi:TPA: Dot/Icm T4SS effector N-acetyltransferase VipF [Legionella pneumophila]|uniref:Dot/Icm T4SS effector N-acetyltransferase VipF n=1 Tax=Legionella pneumophila TaxID=446 RepID=UPI001A28C730|nr:Dot/Icm T4SS effector N-acetyltransferase VipF [Legionella pneumophila]HAT8879111.1 Dot/Icm T4SS effector N-acetyltransferase VipF [Legionella pneumophila subsp. pneumophila]MCW8456063.1 Dot/Icm T4SS effector N-acetyltransferase VipF [Legionella pneumophila]HAT9805013.1 Dot/Icm T4SS effector N-acetyltransferase VipF [Legionella pneumophila subsp. pneumophila]HAU0184422.1 GNAT family N-acetyltransferase [Legionella pneumophila]HAU0697716.1 GNAT family N-acetyltransferase [Legionella pneumoph